MGLSVGERRVVRGVRPRTRREVAGWVRAVVGVEVADRAVMEGNACPLDYLCHAFFEGEPARDCVVWANRGGGKTFYAAVATAMDLLFKPGIEVMILGGSLDQSRRMMAHLHGMFGGAVLGETTRRVTERRIELRNGSRAEVLAQSQTSVRGTRPQKIRCDEIDLFDREVWEAAQFVTRSKVCGGVDVAGSVEALGTWHDPHGLMGELVDEARREGARGRRLFRWGVVDVLERCPPPPEGPACAGCVLEEECGGGARGGRGHVRVADAVQQKGRSDAASWGAEMLCRRPSRRLAVYPEFDERVHVGEFEVVGGEGTVWVGGIDFGFANPTVILWASVGADGVVRVVDERVAREATLERHVEAIRGARWPVPRWFGVDPAGRQRSDQTGLSAVQVLGRAGLRIRARRVRLEDGVRAVRARLAPATGEARLVVHARCVELIGALKRYRFGERGDGPRKDGADHACDALRYLVVNLEWKGEVEVRGYWGKR